MKKIIISALVTAFSLTCIAQSSLYVSPGADIVITANTTVFVDSLKLKPSATFTISGANSLTKDATATPPPASAYINRVYHFLQTTSAFSGEVAVYYRDTELNGLDENTLNLSQYNGTAWLAYSPSSRDGVNNVVTRTGLAAVNLNELTLTAPGTVVPVSLYRFTAEGMGCTARLSWSTASEQNSKHFEVLQSTDGINFSLINIVPAAINSTTIKDYSYTASLNSKENYFRLRMVDIDGQSKFSNVLRVVSDCNKNNISIFPNPTKNSITVSGLSGRNQLRLIDQAGRAITNMMTANPSETIDLTRMAAGTYIVQVIQGNRVIKNIKIIKE